MFFTSDWSILLKNATSLRIYLSHNVLLCIDKVMPHWGGSFFKTFFWWYYRVQLWKESLCIFPVSGRSLTTLTRFWPPTPYCVLKWVLTWSFLGNQDATLKQMSELIFDKILLVFELPYWPQVKGMPGKS